MSWTALLGIVFLALSVITTYLMFQFWGYPYDKEKRKSECPQWKMNIHRGFGFAYAGVYVVMMIEMVPRLWQYQVEFPARTVAHLLLGITIGVVLLVKISILRWFRHFEEWMPALGVILMTATFLLSGLSLPFAFAEQSLVDSAVGGHAYSDENRARVRTLLDGAGLPEGTDLDALATADSLRDGRQVLLEKCVYCHDLRTAIARPRTPANWVRTVDRMVAKPTLGPVIKPHEAHQVSAYLVAITPDLQESMKAVRVEKQKRAGARKALAAASEPETAPAAPSADAGPGAPDGGPGEPSPAEPTQAEPAPAEPAPAKPAVDAAQAKETYEEVCSQCHELSDVTDEPPTTVEEADEVMERMVENGMEEDAETLELVRWYLVETFVKAAK